MTRPKRIVLCTIVAIQFLAALYFVSGAAAEYFGITRSDDLLRLRAAALPVNAVGLMLGVVLGWVALRRSIAQWRLTEAKLRAASGVFIDLLEDHFATWGLTPAERDVALFAIKGLSTREIAAMRGTSEGTIKAQTNAIYRKAGVAGRPQLLSLFIEDLLDGALLDRAHRNGPAEGVGDRAA